MRQIQNLLIIGVRVNCGHKPLDDSEMVVDDLGHRSQTVRGTGSIGNNVVFGRIILIFVDAQHDGDVFPFGRRANDDFLGPGLDVLAGSGSGAENAGRLKYDVYTEVAPRQCLWVTFGEDQQSVPVDHQVVPVYFYRAGEATVVAIVLQQMSVDFRTHQVVDSNDINDIRVILYHCFE